jgi:hypothetical protein
VSAGHSINATCDAYGIKDQKACDTHLSTVKTITPRMAL